MAYEYDYSEGQARKNIDSFYNDVEMPGGYTFNHAKILQMVDLYYNSKYKTGAYDSLGLRKFFYNVVKPACDIATKFIDLDTKDIILIPEHNDDDNEFRVWIMQKKLKQWLKDTDFGSLLNDTGFNLPKYGTVVLKKSGYDDDSWKRVNIQNLRMNPTVECLDYSEFVYELAVMSRTDIVKMKEWNSDAVSELFNRGFDQSFVIYNCYDKTEKGWKRTIRGDLYSKRMKDGTISRSIESEINDKNRSYYGALELYSDDVDTLPYRELHWEKVPGRWLGFGFVEYLEENQIAINEAENLERKGLIFSSLQLWQTRDENVAGSNILSSAQNGDILKVDSEITKIDMAERNLSAFNNTRGNWTANTERKTFTTDITTGANLPSRTPLGVANLQASLASSYFELKRENFGLFLKELLLEDIIPDFADDTVNEHVITFLGSDEDLDRLDQMIVKLHVDNAVMDYALQHGYFPSQMERERVKGQIFEQIRKDRNRYLTVPRNAYTYVSYFVDITITGESVDNGAKSQVLQLALQILNSNPAILQNPVTKQIFVSLLSLGGISAEEIGINSASSQAAPQQGQAPLQQGGSISAPSASPAPTQTSKVQSY